MSIHEEPPLQRHLDPTYQLTALLPALFGMACWMWMFGIGLANITVNYLRHKFKPQPVSSKRSKSEAPGVSILRPLKGVDINLRDNLESSFTLEYPNFEILFSVADERDPAIEVVKELMAQFPMVDAQLIVGEPDLCVNPKVNNLLTSYTLAKNEIVWILDSNISSVDCLLQHPSIGIVHHTPIGMNPESFGAALEQLYLNTSHVRVYTMVNKLQLGSCVIGKSNMFRKCELEHVGGLAHFGQYMSEDNIIGQTLWNRKRAHAIPADFYFKRRARWTRIRRFTVLAATILEPFMESYAFGLFFNVPRVWFFCWHITHWFLLDLLCGLIVEKSMITDNFPRYCLAWIVREVTALPILLHAFVGSTVEWRGRKFRLKPDGTVVPDSMQECNEKKVESRSEVVVDSLSKVLCCSNVTFGGKIIGVCAVMLAVFLFLGAVVAEGVKGVVAGEPITNSVGCVSVKSDSQVSTGSKANVEAVAFVPSITKRRSVDMTSRLNRPLWEAAASFISGCRFSTPPTTSEAWKIMFGSLVERISKQSTA
ncbi:hypothetical protein BCR33DRAFT_721369 [Rhizoclosmatium globosum]|uniref:Ceramide glucosyltransferase n=1 Tax=Rhizoclosmatium globosum TaxID=329046 RepID=A0A1Y2BU36_9FUNG|nr:hypothetical protein BCR33DRAFT_721369 [Rhizoclosmatium globosum]|eukprot:ORY37635.1 hypothetical protein BCR33DRAFT_721369 [Rhizoclosmatium globosum]